VVASPPAAAISSRNLVRAAAVFSSVPCNTLLMSGNYSDAEE
jgi:hypothetical protein